MFSQIPEAPDGTFSQVCAPYRGLFSQIPTAPGDCNYPSLEEDVSFGFRSSQISTGNLSQTLDKINSAASNNEALRQTSTPVTQKLCPVKKRQLFHPPLQKIIHQDIKKVKLTDTANKQDRQNEKALESKTPRKNLGDLHMWETPASDHATNTRGYTPSPLVLQHGIHQGVKLKSVTELPEKYRPVFSFPFFNVVQSKVFDEVFYSDKPVVLCAPTGAGKTVIFELAIIRMIMKLEVTQMQNNYKVVYMAPIKALCRERFVDWQQKFTCYGMKCQELTGDSDIDDYNQLQDVNMIFTTPEKWDSMTRKWRDNKFLVQSVSLFLVDEIHMLNDSTRGSTIEAVVSRMKTIQQALSRSMSNSPNPQLRFIAVSATIPNIIDVAHWLGDGENPATHFKLDESYRPVVLRKVILGFPYNENKGSEFRFDLTLSYRLMGIINTYSERKPTLVFCSTRKSTQQAAEILVKDSNGMYVRSTDQRQILLTNANMLKDNKLRDLVMKGVGYHHAGLDIHDRKIMEDLFSEGNLSVLVATSTLAMGVNLPAHLVIVKSTVHYNMGVHVAYSDSEILQMIGRAGRPQFDTSATAVIMTKSQDKYKYDSLVNGTQLIESSLHKNLIEHLNAEIVLHTINDISIAMEWIRYTFLYIRIMKNPRHYGMPPDCEKEEIERKLQDLCMRCLNQLNSLHLITMDEESIDVKPTEAGRLMARYCIAYETMKKFSSIAGTESINDLLKIISSSEEFCEIQLRINEKKTLNMLNNDKNRQTIRYQFPGKIKTKQMKVNCLIQAALGCLMVQDFSLQQETNRIFRVGQRVTRCLVEFLWMRDNYKAVLSAIHLNKCLRARLWEDSKYVTKQLEGIGPAMSNALVNAGIDSFQKIEEKNPRELELIVNRHPPFGNQLRDSVSYLPKYELTIDQVAKYGESCSEIIINISIANAEKVQQGKTTSDYHMCMLLIGDEDNHVVFRRKILDTHLIKDGGFTKKIEVSRAANGPDLNIDFISQEWVGIDVQCRYTPIYLGGTKRIANTVRKDQQCSSVKGSNQVVLVRELDEGREECNHRCVNKAMCGHECCKHGIVKKAVPTKSLVRTPSVNRAKFMDSYVSDLKNKIQPMPETPRISTKVNTMRENVIDLTKFAYCPSDRMSWQISDERQPKTTSALDMFYSNRLNQNSVNKSEVRAPITPHNTTTGRSTDNSWIKLDLFMRGRDRSPVELSDEEENGPTVYSDRYEDNDIEENGYEGDDIGDFDLQSYLFPMKQSNLGYRGTSAQNVHSDHTAARDADCLSDWDNSLPKLVRGPNKSHRYGKVVAWSNSQEAVGDEVTGDWSGSDNDLITAEQQLSQSYNSGTQDGHSEPTINTSEHQFPQSYNSRTLEGQCILVQNTAKQPQVNVSRSERQQTKPSNTDNSVHKSSGFTNSSDTFMTDYKWNNNCCSNINGNLQKQQNYPQVPLGSSVKSASSVCSMSESRTKDTAYMASLSNNRPEHGDCKGSLSSKNTDAPCVFSKNCGFQANIDCCHVNEIENQDSLYNNDHVEPAAMKQSNIMQYGRLVKKPVYKANINSPVSSRSVKRGSFTSFFTDCFTGADEVPNDSAVGDDGLDTFDSIFDGIF